MTGCQVFEDFGEQVSAFDFLDDCASMDNHISLDNCTGSNSHLMKLLNDLSDMILKKEQATIDKNPARNYRLGFSYESEVVGAIYAIFIDKNTPAKLAAYLPDLKLLLMQSMVILHRLRNDQNELTIADLAPAAEYGKKRKLLSQKSARKASIQNTKYSKSDKEGWERRYGELLAANPLLSVNAAAQKIASESADVKSETVRKYISTLKK